MKILPHHLLLLTASLLRSHASAADPAPSGPETGIVISIIDDSSGGDARGALDPETAVQLNGLLELSGATTLTLLYSLVQETASEPVSVTLQGWTADLSEPPSQDLPYAQFVERARAYAAELKNLRGKRDEWLKTTATEFDAFVAGATAARLALEARWLQVITRGKGRDFNRSAVADTILAAAKECRSASNAFLILATDGIDLPGGGRPPRKTPLTDEELPSGIKIIFVDPDGKKPDAPLFAGISPDALVAKDLGEAIALVTRLLQEASATR